MAAEVGGGEGKRTPRIDMTPMVDLGFLLITFFVLTTKMSNPKAMQITVPAPPPKDQVDVEIPEVPADRVLTFLLSGENRLYWYMGKTETEGEQAQLNLIGYNTLQILNLITEKQKLVLANPALQRFADRDLIVMLKLGDDASYKNLVDMLDNMTIADQGKYMLVDWMPEEVELVQGYEKAQNMESSIARTLETVGLPAND